MAARGDGDATPFAAPFAFIDGVPPRRASSAASSASAAASTALYSSAGIAHTTASQPTRGAAARGRSANGAHDAESGAHDAASGSARKARRGLARTRIFYEASALLRRSRLRSLLQLFALRRAVSGAPLRPDFCAEINCVYYAQK